MTEYSQSVKLLPYFSSFIHLFFHPTPRSLILIRHVHIRGRGDAFMIIYPSYPLFIMAALEAHPLRTRHLALALFNLTLCVTTLFNGLLGEGCRGLRQGKAGNFARVSSRWGPSKELLEWASVIVIDGTMLKGRVEEAGRGVHYLLLYALSVWPHHSAG